MMTAYSACEISATFGNLLRDVRPKQLRFALQYWTGGGLTRNFKADRRLEEASCSLDSSHSSSPRSSRGQRSTSTSPSTPPAYKRGFAMQASLAVIGFVLGLLAWWQTGNRAWLLGAVVLITNWPYTLLGIMPTNQKLMVTDPAGAGPESRALIERWSGLHAVRAALGFIATTIFLWASMS